MFKRNKRFKISVLTITILSVIALTISVWGAVVFSSIPVDYEVINAIVKAFIITLSLWNIVFALIQLTAFLCEVIRSKKIRDILMIKYCSGTFSFDMAITIFITTIILLLFIIVGLSL